ncbi:MAG: UDP-N-acetylmuramate--L-alanine ligase [bacterium]|nr:UDP-N-acetylmuramate--L-alanine ligase [bacterium]
MKIHFIGIGGIGVSALAKYYLSRGDRVFGSDLASSEITQGLTKIGAKISTGPHKSSHLKLCVEPGSTQLPELVIYSPAVIPDNPELKTAKKWGIKCLSYPEALGELTKKYFTIAVCGTHGKGTTTAMISLILIKAGFDPTVIIGTKLKEFGDSNYRRGKSKYLLIEADEYKASFLNYWPKAIVITIIDKDHLDYFKNLENIIKTFRKFIGHLPKNGILITNKDDENTKKLISNSQFPISNKIPNLNFQTREYSLTQKEAKILKRILKIPGDHIIADALAALTLARILKIPDKISFAALGQYHGAWRRFEQKKLVIGDLELVIIQDYAHHPTEIKVTLDAVRQKYPNKRIWCIFQPHQYERTYYLFKDFTKVFAQAPIDKLILAPIYSVAGRESMAIKNKVSSQKLAAAIQQIHNTQYPPSSRSAGLRRASKISTFGGPTVGWQNTKTIYIPSIQKISEYLKKNLKADDVLVVMGAGNIYQLASQIQTLQTAKNFRE